MGDALVVLIFLALLFGGVYWSKFAHMGKKWMKTRISYLILGKKTSHGSFPEKD